MAMPALLRATEREARVWSRLWLGSSFSTIVGPILFLLAMGFGLGGLVNEETADLEGLRYIEFIAPGLLIATATQAAAGGSLWPVTAGHKWLGFHHAMVATPLRPVDAYGGMVVWNALRAMLGAAAFMVAAALSGAVLSWWGFLAVPIAGLTSMAFAAPLTAFAATQDSDAAFEVLMRMVIMPLTLFSGTLFAISQLPVGLRFVAALFPMWHGVELARASTTGTLGLADLGHAAVVAAYIGVGWWWGARTFTRRLAS